MTESTTRDGEPSDAALIARWRGGDERAATILVERHAPAVSRFVASMGERTEVEEVVQDTFVRAFASLEGFRKASSLRTWLFSIARNLCRDRARSNRRGRLVVPIEEAHALTVHDPLSAAVATETESRLFAAMEKLTETQRAVFTLRVTEGLSYREIADVVKTTEGAARVHYHNAVRSVKEYLDE
jgi:RNA polymerase sigma-70 factor (ECF subfamily)